MNRCPWTGKNELMIKYHDEEWGVPLHDDHKLFEFILLDAFQAGLSWSTIINKRENFRKAFDNYDIKKIASYDESKIEELMQNPGIIRNKSKISASISNAKSFLQIQKEFGSFDKYIWDFTNGKTIINKFSDIKQVPPKTELADKVSKDLIKRGFKFVGPTICYAFMQASGIVNDHLIYCFRHHECNNY